MFQRLWMRFMKSQPNIILEDEQIIAALIGLGSNVDSEYGARPEVLKLALQELSKLTVRPLIASSFYESEIGRASCRERV